ncbi:hypothetical protein [Bacillus sp. ISL-7]|uniref:hypothetical protein n=1 Tax=Bacillus sp. ISL-7 TaxID=2819136 RepID=UPI001BE92059|nr:hypothetical protein [Bacillus sp. ISL-7]MBT2739024.1 hypothetical protein [Bacillus sp. ISL-7]
MEEESQTKLVIYVIVGLEFVKNCTDMIETVNAPLQFEALMKESYCCQKMAQGQANGIAKTFGLTHKSNNPYEQIICFRY